MGSVRVVASPWMEEEAMTPNRGASIMSIPAITMSETRTCGALRAASGHGKHDAAAPEAEPGRLQ